MSFYDGGGVGAALTTGLSDVSATLAYSAICSSVPTLCVGLAVSATMFSSYNALIKVKEFITELTADDHDQCDNDNYFMIEDCLIFDTGTESQLVQEYGYWG